MANFSLDYDDTFTADPELWRILIPIMKERGHQIYMITARHNTIENKQELFRNLDGLIEPSRIYFSYDAPKRWFADREGLFIDIWIDDSPEAIAGWHQ